MVEVGVASRDADACTSKCLVDVQQITMLHLKLCKLVN